jgi:prolipoprotein diacylglyceryltransferase
VEFTLLGAVLVAFLAGYGVLWWEAGRTNAADCTRDVWDALVSALVVGLVVGRVAAMVLAGTNPVTNPGDLLIVRGGVDTIAATLAGLGTFAWQTRSDLARLADAAAPAALAVLAGWHAGCLVRDTCLGTSSDLPWAIAQPGSTVTRHPVEIYAALVVLIGVVALIVWKHRQPREGAIGAASLAVATIGRLVTEPMRPGLGTDLAWFYAVGLVVATAFGVWLLRRRSPHPGD